VHGGAAETVVAASAGRRGNLVETTLEALDSLFNLDRGATWDSTANGGIGGIVSSNAPPGAESARVVLVGLYAERDHSAGSSSVRFRRTAFVFVDTYSRTTLSDNSEIRGDIVFRFLRFGPWCVSPRSFALGVATPKSPRWGIMQSRRNAPLHDTLWHCRLGQTLPTRDRRYSGHRVQWSCEKHVDVHPPRRSSCVLRDTGARDTGGLHQRRVHVAHKRGRRTCPIDSG